MVKKLQAQMTPKKLERLHQVVTLPAEVVDGLEIVMDAYLAAPPDTRAALVDLSCRLVPGVKP